MTCLWNLKGFIEIGLSEFLVPHYGANICAPMEYEAPPSTSSGGSDLTWFSIDGDVFGTEGTVGEWLRERGEEDREGPYREGAYRAVLLGGWCGDTAEVRQGGTLQGCTTGRMVW